MLRYFVDERSGCVAVRDRKHPEYDPEYPGLHPDMPDVVLFWSTPIVEKRCAECGHRRHVWGNDSDQLKSAYKFCNDLLRDEANPDLPVLNQTPA